MAKTEKGYGHGVNDRKVLHSLLAESQTIYYSKHNFNFYFRLLTLNNSV